MSTSRKARQQASRPTGSNESLTPPSTGRDYNQSPPVFCLHHLVKGYDIQALEDKDSQAQFALTLHQRAQLRWAEIQQTGRHASGTEWIKAGDIKPHIPDQFSDRAKFMAFRYKGKLPMVGVRINDVFHVLWVERQFGDVYDH